MNVVLAVGGGIAAYKSAIVVRELQRGGAKVRVVMTKAAQRFIGSATFAGLTGEKVVTSLWEHPGEIHVELGNWADAIVVAPATMDLLAKAAAGLGDDPVLATLSCAKGQVFFAPAMHWRMWERPSTQRSVATLTADGATMIGPDSGPLASGESGLGRMSEPEAIAAAVLAAGRGADLKGATVLVSAGPTHEDLDPVRFLGNRSTGRMGFAVAAVAASRGAKAILVAGPSALPTPPGVERVDVRSARDMEAAIRAHLASADAVVMAAAVADYRPADTADEKIKKSEGGKSLALVRNPDILAGLGAGREGDRPVLVGFALETSDAPAKARAKLERKKVDLVVANLAKHGFGGEENEVTLVDAEGDETLPRSSKRAIAHAICDRIAARLAS
ncbi:MAG: bifunctional phosphopantothenoylcysteine decarboxylase/phosphopantothenate--cysteine ligase CoaBC [Deltaproteobacteria bacterium]|nr:bifunctional phosphopantothenoylcysteine decarboxylase/phosphopantothenate--cysteine ligase CoaBC [Deltaproteobacteria bacterium]